MDDFFQSGRAVDLALVLLAAEVAALVILRLARGIGPRTRDTLLFALAGAALLLAVRFALTGREWMWVAAALTLSLPAHIGLLVSLSMRGGASRP